MKPKPGVKPPEWDTERTAQLLDVTIQHLGRLAKNGIIPGPTGREWPAVECSCSYIRYLRDRQSEQGREDKERREKAQADIAEMESAKLRSELCFRSDYENDFAEGIRIGIDRVMRLSNLTESQKRAVCDELRAMRLPELDEPAHAVE